MRLFGRTGTSFIMGLLVGALALGAGMAVAHNDGTEIRITAMRHESDGRIEFAVQERDGDGWGERVLPHARFFPASGREGRWLNSSPITVGVVEGLETATATPTATTTPTATATATPVNVYGDTNAETANLWVYIWDDYIGDTSYLNAGALIFADIDAFDLDVSVRRGLNVDEFCNASPMYDGEYAELSCVFEEGTHTDVTGVTARLTIDYQTSFGYRCTRQAASDGDLSTWACWLRP